MLSDVPKRITKLRDCCADAYLAHIAANARQQDQRNDRKGSPPEPGTG